MSEDSFRVVVTQDDDDKPVFTLVHTGKGIDPTCLAADNVGDTNYYSVMSPEMKLCFRSRLMAADMIAD